MDKVGALPDFGVGDDVSSPTDCPQHCLDIPREERANVRFRGSMATRGVDFARIAGLQSWKADRSNEVIPVVPADTEMRCWSKLDETMSWSRHTESKAPQQ